LGRQQEGVKYRAQSPASKIKTQTQCLLEHEDLSEMALNGKVAQIAQICNERNAVPGAGVQEPNSPRTESAC